MGDEYDLTAGAVGLVGPANPTGPAGVLAFYTRSATSLPATGVPDEGLTPQAPCDAGYVVVGGGIEYNHADGSPHSAGTSDITSKPNGSGTGRIGEVERSLQAIGTTLTVYSRCADITR